MLPTFHTALELASNMSGNSLCAVFQCPGKRCKGVFLAYYAASIQFPGTFRLLKQALPVFGEPTSFTPAIENVSPKFVMIFNEALTAESNGLYEVCGCGYRRALEFLIKD